MVPISYLVYSENYLACLLITTRTNQVHGLITTHAISSCSALGVDHKSHMQSTMHYIHSMYISLLLN